MTPVTQALSLSADPRIELATAMAACRAATCARVAELDDEDLRVQPDPAFSPIGWHLGHIAYTEALWLTPGGDPHPEWQRLFRQDGLPKAARRNLPSARELADYLAAVRAAALDRLERGASEAELALWRFVLQHEAQHAETIAFVRRLAGFDPTSPQSLAAAEEETLIEIPAGRARQGHDGPDALDNERAAHGIELAGFRLARRPVSERQYRRFIDAGGYREPALWSAEGWAWCRESGVERPHYWAGGAAPRPVHGISAYEAEAYCRFIGARLPSEAEWERAQALHPECAFLGEVWQWTASTFACYPGFAPFPYRGYSAAYFDGGHRVLKGGSWASLPPVLRPSFRNWYVPSTRQIFAGFRYATQL
ncbi:MAG TPA: SUMF1/EgtB/PvdO family nonheme iron enzyme [Alphaproteobacteria bacterium]|nr:SUMF1/EgtB/PvdO family nonheme iron enzyme [Alphaproteobacteria bacterium]